MTNEEMKWEFIDYLEKEVGDRGVNFTSESFKYGKDYPEIIKLIFEPCLLNNKKCSIKLANKSYMFEKGFTITLKASGIYKAMQIVSYEEFLSSYDVSELINGILYKLINDIADYILGRGGNENEK